MKKMTPKEDKKRELKRLFYSNLTSIELQRRLDITNEEYQKLLHEVKNELGLPSSYRRTPHRYGKYVKDSFFIKKYSTKDEYLVISYAPTIEDAENKLRILDDGISVYEIEQATDEHMKELIKKDYFEKHMLWSDILRKYQMPYHKFYSLLNQIKEENGLKDTRTAKDTRYIYKYKRNGRYLIRKNIKGKPQAFGYYKDIDIAVHVRDYLEDIHWNVTKWKNNREKVVKEAENGS